MSPCLTLEVGFAFLCIDSVPSLRRVDNRLKRSGPAHVAAIAPYLAMIAPPPQWPAFQQSGFSEGAQVAPERSPQAAPDVGHENPGRTVRSDLWKARAIGGTLLHQDHVLRPG